VIDDWSIFRSLGHRIVDDLADYLSTIAERPIATPITQVELDAWTEPVPFAGLPPEIVYKIVRDRLFNQPLGNLHPRYWGWADGSGLPLAALANLLATALNPNVEGMDHSACLVELQVVRWWASVFGLPTHTSGLLVSGTSTANLMALAIARTSRISAAASTHPSRKPVDLFFYASQEAHASVPRALRILGHRKAALRLIGTLADGAIDPNKLRSAILKDIKADRTPTCVIATAGTTVTGAVDDLVSIRAITREYNMWLHVDGAYGALAHLASSGKGLIAGIENADSLAFDLHKWPGLPFGTACLLTPHGADHLKTFAIHPDYLVGFPVPPTLTAPPLSSLGIEVSREFRALRVWMCMRAYGIETFASLIERNLAQARYLRSRITADSAFQLIAPTNLNIVCFRWRGVPSASLDHLNAVNQKILARLLHRPRVVVSGAFFQKVFVLRAAIFNHRSVETDFDQLLETIRQEAATVTGVG
jgi:glutamate/tyrosine decarboxylase-like PLP-dependent enzyme